MDSGVLVAPRKLDLGCGPNKKAGFHGVDVRPFDGVDTVIDIGADRWPWADGSIEEAHSSHCIEHLAAPARCHFMNELYRVLAPGAKATIIAPYWGSTRAYGDPTHVWPPVSDMFFYYLKREWREANAPHNDGYTCDFDSAWGYAVNPALATRNSEYVQHALESFKEAASDTVATLTKRGA